MIDAEGDRAQEAGIGILIDLHSEIPDRFLIDIYIDPCSRIIISASDLIVLSYIQLMPACLRDLIGISAVMRPGRTVFTVFHPFVTA